jgi:hypothetical protein
MYEKEREEEVLPLPFEGRGKIELDASSFLRGPFTFFFIAC